ncbi:MAG: preprotein translocase subunit SecD, partial [Thermotogaceae bacterium]|nr:preprotein translocase subunit SecD [Thermotogaceae bacterium]
DANLTTILAGIALYLLGKGTIKGFATTLIIGVIGSMFTVLVVSRVILDMTSNLVKNKYSKSLSTNEGVAK